MEIEKKYLVKVVPNLLGVKCTRIEQHYIGLGEKEEVRIRRKGGKCFITVKSSGILERDEWESEIPEDVYTALFPAAKNRAVIKDRYEIKLLNDNIAELDVYQGKLEGLNHLTIEVEFRNKEEANIFIEPDWFGKDVTNDVRYKNKNLAINGWPEE